MKRAPVDCSPPAPDKPRRRQGQNTGERVNQYIANANRPGKGCQRFGLTEKQVGCNWLNCFFDYIALLAVTQVKEVQARDEPIHTLTARLSLRTPRH